MKTLIKNLSVLFMVGMSVAVLAVPTTSAQEALRLSNRVLTGNSITFTVSINNAPNDVQTLGFDVVFDENALQYTGFTPGSLVATWTVFGVNQVDTGARARLRIGGFTVDTKPLPAQPALPQGEFPLPDRTNTTDPVVQQTDEVQIAATMTGEVVFLTFSVKSPARDAGGTSLRIENTTDQISPSQDQRWTIGNCTLLNLDLDGDGQVLPGTDGVLLRRFLSSPTLSDANLMRGNAIAPGCTRCTAQAVRAFLQALDATYVLGTNTALDIDGDGQVLPGTDGILLRRFLSSPTLSDANLMRGNAIAPGCTRCTAQAVRTFLQRLLQ